MIVALALAGAAFPQRSQAAEAKPPVILALGTSLTAGFNLPQEAGFPARLEAALRDKGIAAKVLNGGVSGDTSAGGRARLDWLLDERVTHAIVELGSNDALRGLDPGQTEANLAAILDALKARGITVLLAGMLAPPNMGPEYAQAFNGVFPRLAEAHDVPLYPFFLEGVAAEPALNLADGIHPNEAGVTRIVEGILPAVLALPGIARD